MPFSTVKLRGGVNAELTPVLNEAGISASNLIRFKDGLPQKLGGWSRYYPAAVPTAPRALHAWEDLEAVNHLAIAGDTYLGIVTNGVLQPITPQFSQLDFAPAFTTTAGSTIVNVQYPGANVGDGDVIVFATPVSVGGLILTGTYDVADGHGPDSFDITAASPATSSVTSGGVVPIFSTNLNSATIVANFPNHGYAVGSTFAAVAPTSVGGLTIQGFYTVSQVQSASQFSFQTPQAAGFADSQAMNGGNARIIDWIAPYLNDQNSGYGIGGYGQGGYGAGFLLPIHSGALIGTGSSIPLSGNPDWSLDNWGEILVGCYRSGPIFQWGPSQGVLYAQVIANAPIAAGGIFIAMPEQIMVAWGASVLGIQDPLLVRWCDVSNFTVWTADVGNQAGSFRIPRGSMIVGGMQGPQQALLWTDLSVWSMQYVGYPLVFGFNEIASGCGLIAQHAAVTWMSSVFWMSQKAFFVLAGGAVQPIECPVWDVIFQNLNQAFVSHIRAAANSQFNEVAWYYPSAASANGENDSYVKLNTVTGEWDYGQLARSAWIDQSVLGPPIGASPTGVVYQHETSPDADGQPLNAWFETGDFMLADGEDMPFIDYVIPDFKYGGYGQPTAATVQVTLRGTKFPNAAQTVKGPYSVQTVTPAFGTRLRGRFISMRVESQDTGSFWRLGGMKFRYAPDGRA